MSIDESQSLRAKFAVKAKGGSAIKVHQAFLRFTNVVRAGRCRVVALELLGRLLPPFSPRAWRAALGS